MKLINKFLKEKPKMIFLFLYAKTGSNKIWKCGYDDGTQSWQKNGDDCITISDDEKNTGKVCAATHQLKNPNPGTTGKETTICQTNDDTSLVRTGVKDLGFGFYSKSKKAFVSSWACKDLTGLEHNCKKS